MQNADWQCATFWMKRVGWGKKFRISIFYMKFRYFTRKCQQTVQNSVFLTSVYAVKLTWLWPDSAQVRVRVRPLTFFRSQSQSQVSLAFHKSEILTRFYKWILGPKSLFFKPKFKENIIDFFAPSAQFILVF